MNSAAQPRVRPSRPSASIAPARQHLQPARDGAGVEVPRLQPVRGDQLGGVLDPAGGDRVVDRLVDAPAGRVPCRRAGVQLGDEVRLGARELALQQVAQQVVVAEPVAAVVERDDEQVRPERLGEQRGAVGPAGDRGAQRRAHALEDRRAQQELPQRPRRVLDHLVQVVADLAVVAGQRADERGAVAAAPEGERGELEPGRPALRPLLQPVHVGRFEAELERAVEQLVGLGVGELQLLRPDLHELAGRPEARERQRRVGAAGDRDPQRPRQVAQEVRDRGVQELVVQQVVVVEHEHDRRLPAAPAR